MMKKYEQFFSKSYFTLKYNKMLCFLSLIEGMWFDKERNVLCEKGERRNFTIPVSVANSLSPHVSRVTVLVSKCVFINLQLLHKRSCFLCTTLNVNEAPFLQIELTLCMWTMQWTVQYITLDCGYWLLPAFLQISSGRYPEAGLCKKSRWISEKCTDRNTQAQNEHHVWDPLFLGQRK